MMRKLFTIFSFVFLYLSIAFGQAFIDIPLLATDGSVPSPLEIAVGLDLTATNGIDTHLGEASLPPLAPGLDVRFDLGPYGTNATTYKDYRAPGDPPAFPYSGTIQHTIILQHSAAGLDITIDFDLPDQSEMTITDQIGGSFLNIGPFTGTGTATIPGSYLDIFTKAFLIMGYTDIVPVELTATELNNQGFEIERSSSTQDWTKIGYVPGFGTTSEPKTYSYTDDNIVTGIYTYRLKQVDYDGTFSYSDEVEVEVDFAPSDYALFQNYPNPFNPSTSVKFQVPQTSNVTVVIYNMLGQEVRTLFAEEVVRGTYTANWNGLNNAGDQMSSGSYIYKMIAGDFVQSKKMVLLK
jgi:hypothetical protein